MDLDIAELKSIVAIAKLGSFSDAASALHISQPALSRRIALAEAKLGATLFDRLSRGVRPTESCSALLTHAEAAIESMEKAIEAFRAVAHRKRHNMVVGLPDALCDHRILQAFRQLVAHRPEMSFEFRSFVHSDQLSGAVLNGTIDIGIRYRAEPDSRLISLILAEDEVIVVCAPQHEMARSGKVDRDTLGQQTWISYPIPSTGDGGGSRDVMEAYDLDLDHTMAVTSVEARLALIEAGFGAGLASRSAVRQRIADRRLVALDTCASTVLPIHLICKHDDPRIDLIRQLGSMLQDHLAAPAPQIPD